MLRRFERLHSYFWKNLEISLDHSIFRFSFLSLTKQGDSRIPSTHKIVPLSSIVKDSEAAVDAGLNIFSEDHQEENILNAGQIAQLEELFELVDSDNSKSVNLSDLIEFSISHNMCGKKEAFMIEEYVKEVSGYDESQISFPEFSSIAIAFDRRRKTRTQKSSTTQNSFVRFVTLYKRNFNLWNETYEN